MTFPNDAARRAYFTDKLRAKLKDPAFRKIEGFPIGDDEDILALSDPPYYTACPNPFMKDFIKRFGKQLGHGPSDANHYSREPFAADVSPRSSELGRKIWRVRLVKSESPRESTTQIVCMDERRVFFHGGLSSEAEDTEAVGPEQASNSEAA